MKTYTLLINNDVLAAYLANNAVRALANGRNPVVVTDVASGKPDATLVRIDLSERAFAAIKEADNFTNTHDMDSQIAVTEPELNNVVGAVG